MFSRRYGGHGENVMSFFSAFSASLREKCLTIAEASGEDCSSPIAGPGQSFGHGHHLPSEVGVIFAPQAQVLHGPEEVDVFRCSAVEDNDICGQTGRQSAVCDAQKYILIGVRGNHTQIKSALAKEERPVLLIRCGRWSWMPSPPPGVGHRRAVSAFPFCRR